MSTKIQFREREMREAIASMQQSCKKLDEMNQYFMERAGWAEKEALQGEAGISLKNAITGKLCPSISQLSIAIGEQVKFAQIELDQMIKAASQLR